MNTPNLSAAQVNVLVERLVKTVARAFYTDNYVVVLDALVREKYIKESELPPRLRLKPKDIRSVLTRLETTELLIKHESLLACDEDGKNRQHKFYYIDYQFFVDIVRYRVFLMQRKVDAQQSEDIQEIKYQCPTCKWTLSMLDATRARSKDNKFICTKCCPYDDFRDRIAAEWYIMLSMESHLTSLRHAGSLKAKLHEAMSVSPLHDSIFAMLKDLNHVKVSRNLPSDNMRLGFRNTLVTDEHTRDAIVESLGKAVAQKKGRYLLENDIERSRRGEENVSVEIEEDLGESGTAKAKSWAKAGGVYDDEDDEPETDMNGRKRVKRASAVPEFLTRSGVTGADEIYQLESLNATNSFKRGQSGAKAISSAANAGGEGAGADSNRDAHGNLAVKSLAPRMAPAVATPAAEEAGDSEEEEEEEEDDIAWEDDA